MLKKGKDGDKRIFHEFSPKTMYGLEIIAR